MVTNLGHILIQSPGTFHPIQLAREKLLIIWFSTSTNTGCVITKNGKNDSKRSNHILHPMPHIEIQES
jgi:hypothetical protein